MNDGNEHRLDESRMDEHHRRILGKLPTGLLDFSDLAAVRAAFAELPRLEPDPSVSIEEVTVAGFDDGPDVALRIYRPANLGADPAGLYWIHGGGMVLGSAERDDYTCAQKATAHRAIVASVDYRLAPDHPFPAPMHDCYAGLSWFADHAAQLGFDQRRLAIGGASAGAGLAAGTALFARDQGGPSLCFQLLVYPMLDHRNVTPASHAILDRRVWHRDANLFGWRSYVGDAAGGEGVSPYASPTMAQDLSGLPPAYINVGDLDLFVDEDVAYALALGRAGVPTELHVYPGAFHGSATFVVHSPLTHRWMADETAALERALNP
jgi:acetyl esterase/lipase